MRAVVKKWGNSASVRIPASVMVAAGLRLDQAVEVREDNVRARGFYAAAGYREIDRRRGYYRIRGRRIDALVMERALT